MDTTTDKVSACTDQELSLLSLLHLSSPALPVGAFAYSQGLEYAMDAGWCKTPTEVESWVSDNLAFGLACLDLPVYQRLFFAWRETNVEQIQYWNALLLALRETRELYDEDIAVGSAYASWHLGQDAARNIDIQRCPKPTVISMHALAAVYNKVDCAAAILGFTWAWVENQVICASKALPMGQTDSQRILMNIKPDIVNACRIASKKEDDDIGSGLLGLAMASASHEQQYSRMFRS